jgi:hypothetical protein
VKTTEKLDTLIDFFFAIKPPTEDEWQCIIYLNAMASTEFKDTRSSLDTLLSAGTLLSAAIAARIKHEQVRIDGENADTAANKASFTVFTKRAAAEVPARSFPNGQGLCANPQCKSRAKQFHDWDHCYGPGGHIPAPKGTGKAKRGGGSSRKDKAKVAVNSSDDSDNQAAFASDRSFFADTNVPHGETTSFDWSTTSVNIAHMARKEPEVLAALILYLDTGATSSICPILKYFTKITLCIRIVSGVGGSSVKAVGISEVRICVGNRPRFGYLIRLGLGCLGRGRR